MFLTNIWYFALLSRDLKSGKMLSKIIAGEPILFTRNKDGNIIARRDICPHRGIPLSCGRLLENGELECCYHGWRFNDQGKCTKIPSLTKNQVFDLSRINVRTYDCLERSGGIWIFMGQEDSTQFFLPEMPQGLPSTPNLSLKMIFPCDIDHAVVGLMDPAHGPFIHRSWFWRSEASIHEKSKSFEPSPLGFRMVRHKPSKNGRAYKILGGAPQTEITFSLPGIRIESIEIGTHQVCGLTTITPIDEKTSEIHHMIYWTLPWLTFLKPLLYPFAYTFLNQDKNAVKLQQRGLIFSPSLMLIKDADTQAKWYYKLKKEYQDALNTKRPFVNPLKSCTLKWQS